MAKLVLLEETVVDEQGHVLVYECVGSPGDVVCSVLQARLGDSAQVAIEDGRIRVTVSEAAQLDTVKEALDSVDTYLGE